MSFISRDLTLVITARSVSLLGDQVAAVALLLRLQGKGAGPWAVAALLVAALAPIVVLSPAVGRLVDRRDNRGLLVASSAAQAAMCSGLMFVDRTAAILALVAALGVGQAVNGACWQALLPTLAGPDRLPRALGISQTANTGAVVAAPALGGLLTGAFGVRVPLAVDAVTFLVITVAAVLVRTRRVLAPSTSRQRGGYGIVAADPVLRTILLLLAVFITLGAAINVVDVFLVRETLHSSATWYGLVGATWGMGMALGALGAGRWSADSVLARGLVVAAFVLPLGITGYAVAPAVGWLLPSALVGGVANGVLNVTTAALLMRRVSSAELGRVGAVIGAVSSGSEIGAYLLAGGVGQLLTPREVIAVAGLTSLLAPIVFARRVLQTATHDADSVGNSRDRLDRPRVHA